MRTSILVWLLLGALRAQAQDAREAQPTLARLCAALRVEEGGARMSRCRTVRTARRGRTRAAVLRVTVLEGNSPEQLVIALRARGGWRRVGTLGPPAYSGHGMLGSLELVELAVRDDDGVPVVDATARSWQGEPDDAGCVHGPEETHRTICRSDEGGWRCLELQVASGPARAAIGPLAEEGTSPACTARPAVEWSLRVELSHGTLTVREDRGAIPEAHRRRLGARAWADAIAP